MNERQRARLTALADAAAKIRAREQPTHRLVVIAANTFTQFADWCIEHRVSVHEPRLLYLTEKNTWKLNLAENIRYVVLAWPPRWGTSDLMLRYLHSCGATEVTPEELAAWEASINERKGR